MPMSSASTRRRQRLERIPSYPGIGGLMNSRPAYIVLEEAEHYEITGTQIFVSSATKRLHKVL